MSISEAIDVSNKIRFNKVNSISSFEHLKAMNYLYTYKTIFTFLTKLKGI